MLFSFVILLHRVLCLFILMSVLIVFSTLFSNTCPDVSNRFDWLNDRHCLSPILCDTVTIFVYNDCTMRFTNNDKQ